MRTEGLRQSDRITLRLPVEVSWLVANGVVEKEMAQTLLVSRNGGVLRLPQKLTAGMELTLRRQTEGDRCKTARARIVAEIDHETAGFLYAVHFTETGNDFWEIAFPPLHKSQEALARLLMECSFCERREVVYLNELELKSFEARRLVARLCPHCHAPSIWVEAQTDAAPADGAPAAPIPEERLLPRRNRTRVRARVLACIRRRGFQEEVAVCEDLSKGGISFRSRNQYPEGCRLEVAVPFTPGSSAIFVPIRVVFSQPLKAAGLFRHGAAYVRPPADV
jgi:hypothetical protein